MGYFLVYLLVCLLVCFLVWMIISSYVIKVKTFPCGFGVDDSASNESRDLRKATSTVDYRLHRRRRRLFLFIVVIIVVVVE